MKSGSQVMEKMVETDIHGGEERRIQRDTGALQKGGGDDTRYGAP